MRVFVYEYVTGGGLAGRPLPKSLSHEADLMARALLADLAEVQDIQVITSRDPRLPPVAAGVEVLTPTADETPLDLFDRGVDAADAVWPTAPESDGVLELLSARVLSRPRTLLGSRPDAIRLTASKSATAAHLKWAGITVPLTIRLAGDVPVRPGPWIVKPDDGAGCEGVVRVADWAGARDRLALEPGYLIAEPWVDGDPVSLSIIAAGGKALLLCCNRQRMHVDEGRVALVGLTVNAFPDTDGRLADLAGRIAAAIPSLWGYVGVDLILGDDGPVVLEINPRLTTSCCGIRRALGANVAALVLNLAGDAGQAVPARPDGVTPVELALETAVGP